jgi:bifunctional non-homologous end joining protein LigD
METPHAGGAAWGAIVGAWDGEPGHPSDEHEGASSSDWDGNCAIGWPFRSVANFLVNSQFEAVSASRPFLEPCHPRPVKRLPTGEVWLHEPKLDGWRVQAVKVGADVALGRDLTGRFAGIGDAVRKLPCRSVTLDCELILVGADGVDSYGLMGKKRPANAALVAFDIMELDGQDLRPLSLVARKAHLQKLMAKNKCAEIAVAPSFEDAERLMIACMEHTLEGVVSKRKNAPYASGSRPEWVKVNSLCVSLRQRVKSSGLAKRRGRRVLQIEMLVAHCRVSSLRGCKTKVLRAPLLRRNGKNS